MLAFLQSGATNRLLKSLSFDFQVQEYLAGCKALGLISELISKPLWYRIEDPSISIMQIGAYYQELVLYLENIDFIKFMEGNYVMPGCDKEQLQHSVVFMSLIKPWEHDCKVQVIIELIIPALLSVIKRILADHLDGGKWDSPTTDLQEKIIADPKHNKYFESAFGYLDRFYDRNQIQHS
jgi:hypothetical protein